MAKRFGRRNKKQKADGAGAGMQREASGRPADYVADVLVRENAAFSAFYKAQGLVPEGEWDAFTGTLQTGLPSTFRVTGHRQAARAVQKHLEDVLIPGLPAKGESGEECPVPSKIPWYPNGLGWNMKSDRKALRTLPEYKAFHEWLKAATENGDISRQEAVSMIPPLLLDLEPAHSVLDMCAAPGSKTAQIVEQMHSKCAEGQLPTGLVIANDLDQKRAYLLHHQVKRILSPCLLVTNNDGALFPNIYGPGSSDALLFDRILADVPCSGDGTLRKNPGLWREWTPALGTALHGLQIRLLDRALQMTKVGGRVVYSTCSMNPVEDEAVLAAVLAKYAGRVRLVDCSDRLPGLRRAPGVSVWKVASRDGRSLFDSWDAIPEPDRRRYPETLFPRPEYSELALDRAMRILPHFQNSGGFFIAVLEKTGELSANAPLQRKQRATLPAAAPAAKEGEDGEYVVVRREHHNLANIAEAYGIDYDRLAGGAFVSRTDRDPLKCLSVVSPGLHAVLAGPNPNLRIVNVGTRAFEIYDPSCRRSFACPYRMIADAATLFEEAGMLVKRRVEVSRADLVALIESDDSIPVSRISDDPTRQEILKYPEGGLVFVGRGSLGHPVVVPVWKGESNVKAFIPKPNRPALLYQLLE